MGMLKEDSGLKRREKVFVKSDLLIQQWLMLMHFVSHGSECCKYMLFNPMLSLCSTRILCCIVHNYVTKKLIPFPFLNMTFSLLDLDLNVKVKMQKYNFNLAQ